MFTSSSCPPPEAKSGVDSDTILIILPSNTAVTSVNWTNPVLETPQDGLVEYIFCDPDPNMDEDIYCKSGEEFPVTHSNSNDGRIKVIYQKLEPFEPFENVECIFYIRILGEF